MIVECNNIKKSFPILRGYTRDEVGRVMAVDDVSLGIERGHTMGLVGESGSGKTTLGKIILGVLKPDSGEVKLNTENIQVIFQDPYNSLDPRMKVYNILSEGLMLKRCRAVCRAHLNVPYDKGSLDDDKKRVEDILDLVKLPRASLKKYPHQFSGGERQRIAIARAILTKPELIVCDEPVSSLDVTIQLQILKLLKNIKEQFSMTYLFISHDLRVIRYMCDRVAVMKDGKIVEEGNASELYSPPTHPYTRQLLSSILAI